MHYTESDGANCTLFETAGCGGFQIADLKPMSPSLFEPEREVVTFQTRADLKEKVDFYLAHPQDRLAIAERAYNRAQKDHTYEQAANHVIGSGACWQGYPCSKRRSGASKPALIIGRTGR
jgi:spore maturation protein CgeB